MYFTHVLGLIFKHHRFCMHCVPFIDKVKCAVTQAISPTSCGLHRCSLEVPYVVISVVSCAVSLLRVEESFKGMKILVF